MKLIMKIKAKKGEIKMKVSATMLLKTHVEKMSLFANTTMFMDKN